ncbi:MAG: hypothetical protein LC105_04345 [Chitinophagales bacterium]|nr:hypothetical protein [Chitinophagales bacterium]
MEKAYVFVVVGTREHINVLHFALQSFEMNTKFSVIVVTDKNRNEIPIIHQNVIHVETPKEFSNHQTAIFLKTSLHRYLPKGGRYVYMDSDILAFGKNCDQIFDEYIAPIRFGADHCNLPFFSPTAINCSCKKDFDTLMLGIQNYVNELDYFGQTDDEEILEQRAELKKRIKHTFNNKSILLKNGIKGFFSWPVFKFDEDFKYNRKEKLWYNSSNQPIMLQLKWSEVAHKFDLKFDYFNMKIKDKRGMDIWYCQCSHLKEEIKKKFQVNVKDADWQHWNGGVFIFDDQSHPFMEYWHQATMNIFKDDRWRVRDQGTLVATAWKFGLQKQPLLHEKWNYICDYNNPDLGYREDDHTLTKDKKTYTQVEFAHVYHHFGDETWDFWKWISKDFKEALQLSSPPIYPNR